MTLQSVVQSCWITTNCHLPHSRDVSCLLICSITVSFRFLYELYDLFVWNIMVIVVGWSDFFVMKVEIRKHVSPCFGWKLPYMVDSNDAPSFINGRNEVSHSFFLVPWNVSVRFLKRIQSLRPLALDGMVLLIGHILCVGHLIVQNNNSGFVQHCN